MTLSEHCNGTVSEMVYFTTIMVGKFKFNINEQINAPVATTTRVKLKNFISVSYFVECFMIFMIMATDDR